MTPAALIARRRASEAEDRSGSQEHFIDLCRLLGEPTPAEADPSGGRYCFERGARKDTGARGWADVWKRHCFAWECGDNAPDCAYRSRGLAPRARRRSHSCSTLVARAVLAPDGAARFKPVAIGTRMRRGAGRVPKPAPTPIRSGRIRGACGRANRWRAGGARGAWASRAHGARVGLRGAERARRVVPMRQHGESVGAGGGLRA